MKVRLLLKYGREITVKVDKFTIEKTRAGALSGFNWTPSESASEKLQNIRVEEVVAVLLVDRIAWLRSILSKLRKGKEGGQK